MENCRAVAAGQVVAVRRPPVVCVVAISQRAPPKSFLTFDGAKVESDYPIEKTKKSD